MTIGNIPKVLRRKPSRHAQILIAYLPTTKLKHITNQAARQRAAANLFHSCLRQILSAIETAGVEGVPMSSGDGVTRRTHPIFACFSGDYPKQVLVAGVKNGDCPKCEILRNELGAPEADYPLRNLEVILDALALADRNPNEFVRACTEAGIKPIYHPFWQGLPYANVYLSITPDILHQGHQGGFRHLVNWLKKIFSKEEIDSGCQCLPPNHNVRLFLNGITSLSKVTGKEHDEMSCSLLGLLINLCLPNNLDPA